MAGIQGVVFDANVLGWAPFGTSTVLSLRDEEHLDTLPKTTAVGHGHKPTGRYFLAAGRADEGHGLCQAITPGALKPRVTYRVAGWISIVSAAAATTEEDGGSRQDHAVRVSICLDDGRLVVDGGAVCAEPGRWSELRGAFRLREAPRSAVVYVHGAPAGVDVKVMDLRIVATDRKARFMDLREKTDKVRKRDVVLSFGGGASNLSGASVRVVQLDNAFPFGSCINCEVIRDPAFVDFFTTHFDWAVFENELKWYWTEAERGRLNYADADTLLDFCDRAGKRVRGHCIFWAVDGDVQQWVKDIGGDRDELMSAVLGRLRGLLSRYAGRFPHYDVNNEMLHGRFYRDRLGEDASALMFREAAALDAGAALFVNDYNVESGNDPAATPEKYVELVRDLQRRGARVDGIGLQGHMTHPVGEVICDALDRLAAACPGLPVWITELDVCEPDEELRADDLELVLREVYAHPAVEGVVLWGFLQGHMWRPHAYLVNPNGTLSDAGQRFVQLRKEWTSEARGLVDCNGQFRFRGFHGTYVVQVTTATGNMLKTFTVDKGDAPLQLDVMDL